MTLYINENTPNSMQLDRFYIQAEIDGQWHSVEPNHKTDKVTWKYKRSAIKAFIRTIAGKHSWFGTYPKLGVLFNVSIRLVDKETKEVLCNANLHNDKEYLYCPRYSITPIDPIAKEYYKSN